MRPFATRCAHQTPPEATAGSKHGPQTAPNRQRDYTILKSLREFDKFMLRSGTQPEILFVAGANTPSLFVVFLKS